MGMVNERRGLIRPHVVKPLPITREPYSKPLTPGLRRKASTEAYGFVHRYDVSYGDEE